MSASREKKMRQNTVEPVVSAEEQKKGMSAGAKRAIAIVAAVVILVLVVFFYMINSGFFAEHTVAADVKGHELTPAMVNYFYVGSYNEMANNVGEELMSYMLDPSVPLDEQECSIEGYDTWADYFLYTGLQSASNYYSIYDEAMANNYVLDDVYAEYIESTVGTLDVYAMYNGMSDADAWLAYQYGPGCNVENYTEYLTVIYTVQGYSASVGESFTYEQADLDDYYAKNPQTFDRVNFRVFPISADETRTAAECEELGKAMAEASKNNEEAYLEHTVLNGGDDAELYKENDDITLREGLVYNSCAAEYRDWLFEEGRQNGDTTYIPFSSDSDEGCYVLYFLENVDLTYVLPSVRHILVRVSDTANAELMAAAKTEAEDILNTYLAGEQTEEAFAELAKKHSADNAEAGGLYENVAPGEMVAAFDSWCFDEARQVGDTGVVETEYGYHVMYFCGEGTETYLNHLIEHAMSDADYEKWYATATGVPMYETKAFGMRFTNI